VRSKGFDTHEIPPDKVLLLPANYLYSSTKSRLSRQQLFIFSLDFTQYCGLFLSCHRPT
jgi:hypothetical protein